MKFADTKRWGQLTFLDYLESNNIKFKYDGKDLSFPNHLSEVAATRIWNHLTGQYVIGQLQRNEHVSS